MLFKRVRIMDTTAGFPGAADAAPTAASTFFEVPKYVAGAAGEGGTRGHAIFARCLAADGSEIATATVGFTVWESVEIGGNCLMPPTGVGYVPPVASSLVPEALVPSGSKRWTQARGPRLFVQVTTCSDPAVKAIEIFIGAEA